MTGIAFAADPGDAGAPMNQMLVFAGDRQVIVSEPGPGARMAGWGRHGGGVGPQPMLYDDRMWVVVEGEVYGEGTVVGPITEPGARIASALLAGQPEDIYRLNGTFSALAWDMRNECLSIVADRLSTRPIYFWYDGRRIAAATRLGALLADERVPRTLDRAGMLETLVHQRTFAGRTIYAGIEGLSAGEQVTLSRGEARRRQIWRPAWTGDLHDGHRITEEICTRTRDAVRRRLPGNGRAGLLLSGGLDSRMVLAAACDAAAQMHCATVSAWENSETRVARQVAAAAGAPFTLFESRPEAFHELLPLATRLVDGMLPAALSLPGTYADIGKVMDTAFSGHFLDVLFRGTYQPKKYVRLIRGRAALPRHRPIDDSRPETISREHHIQTEIRTHPGVLAAGIGGKMEEAVAAGVGAALAFADFDDRYDAFDVFCLHAQGRHHSNTDFLSLLPWAEYRVPALDRDLFDLYLRIPASLRVGQAAALKAMKRLSPSLFALPDAGTGRRGTTGPRTRIVWALWNAAKRRTGLNRPREGPAPWLTEGSWVNWPVWFREEANIRKLVEALPRSPRLMDLGLFDATGLKTAIEAHMSGTANISKLLHQLLTLDCWLAQYPSR